MINFLLMILCLFPSGLLMAEDAPENQDFIQQLDSIKNPFDNGIPKPPPPIFKEPPVEKPKEPEPVVEVHPPIMPQPVPPVVLPTLHVQGVIVGVGVEVYQAIIDGQVVPLHGTIKGAKVNAVTKQGVGFLYKGKKFFLKVD